MPLTKSNYNEYIMKKTRNTAKSDGVKFSYVDEFLMVSATALQAHRSMQHKLHSETIGQDIR